MKISKILLITACSVILFSCEKAAIEFNDKGVTTVVKPKGSTVDSVSFSAEVNPIFQAKCGSCHNPGASNEGDFGLPVAAADAYPALMAGHIVANNVAGSSILGKFDGSHQPEATAIPSEMETIETWINQGATNN